jgi:hypothetical protein
MFTFLLWCILFVLCWPLALLALVAYPFIWLLLLPFRIVGVAVRGPRNNLPGNHTPVPPVSRPVPHLGNRRRTVRIGGEVLGFVEAWSDSGRIARTCRIP